MASFLRKNHRDLRLATLNCLDALFQTYGKFVPCAFLSFLACVLIPAAVSASLVSLYPTAAALTTELYQTALEELPALISDNDLHISQLVLTLLCTVMEVSPGSVVTVKEHILPNTLSLVLSSLLQGSAMVACLNFFRKLVQLGLPGLDFGNIFRVG